MSFLKTGRTEKPHLLNFLHIWFTSIDMMCTIIILSLWTNGLSKIVTTFYDINNSRLRIWHVSLALFARDLLGDETLGHTFHFHKSHSSNCQLRFVIKKKKKKKRKKKNLKKKSINTKRVGFIWCGLH